MLSNYLWRQRTKFEATLAFSMLEPWEKFLSSTFFWCFLVWVIVQRSYGTSAVAIFMFLALLLLSGLYQYLPQHVSIMRQRVIYYLWGQDGDDRLLRHLVEHSALKEL